MCLPLTRTDRGAELLDVTALVPHFPEQQRGSGALDRWLPRVLLRVEAELRAPWQLPGLERRCRPPRVFRLAWPTPIKSDCLLKCGLIWDWLAKALDWSHGGEMEVTCFCPGEEGGATPLSSWGAEGYSWVVKFEGE